MGNELRQTLVIETDSALGRLRDFIDQGLSGLRAMFTGGDTSLQVDTTAAETSLQDVAAAAQRLGPELGVRRAVDLDTSQGIEGLTIIGAKAKEVAEEIAAPHPMNVDPGPATEGLTQAGAAAAQAGESAGSAHGPFGRLKEMFAQGLGTGAAILGLQGIADAVGGSFEAFESQEAADIQLSAAFRDQGEAGKEAAKGLMEFAGERQKLTGTSDDAIEKVVAFGKQLGGITDPEKLKEFAIAVEDYAKATGKDIESATASLAAKLEGGGKDRTLGLKFEPGDSEGNVDRFIESVQGKFGGLSEEIAGTSGGAVARFKASFGELQESIGGVLAAVLGPIAPVLGQVADTVGAILGPIGDELGKAFDPEGPMGAALQSLVGAIGPILTPIVGLIGPILSSAAQMISPILAAGAQLAAVFGPVLTDIMTPLGAILGMVGGIVASVLTPALSVVTGVIGPLVQYAGMLISTALTLIQALLPLVNIALIPLKIILEVLSNVLNALLPPVMNMASQFSEFAQTLITSLMPAIDQITKLFQEQGQVIGKLVSDVLVSLINMIIRGTEMFGRWVATLFGARDASEAFGMMLNFVQGVIQGVVGFIINLRAEVAGAAAALNYAGRVLAEFIDAITSLDVDKATHAFDNFFQNLGDEYQKGKAEFLRNQAPIDAPPVAEPPKDSGSTAPPPKRTPKDKKASEAPLEFDEGDPEKAKRLADQKAQLEAETDEIKKILLKQTFDIINTQADLTAKITDANAKAAEQRKAGKAVDQASLDTFIANQTAESASKEQTIHGDTAKALQAAFVKQGKEDTDVRIATLQEQAKAFKGVTYEEIRKQGEATLEALALQQQNEQRALIEKNDDFKRDLAALTTGVSAGTISVADAETQLAALYVRYSDSSEQLKLLQINQERATGMAKLAISDEIEELRISHLGSTYERDRATAEFEARKKLRVVLDALAEEEAADRDALVRMEITQAQFDELQEARRTRREEAATDSAKVIANAEQEYLQKTNGWYRVSMLFRDSIDTLVFEKKKERNQKELQLEKEKYDLEESYLKEKLAHDLINYLEYTNAMADLADRRHETEEQQETVAEQILSSIREQLATKYTQIAEDSSKEAADAGIRYRTLEANKSEVIAEKAKDYVKSGMTQQAADKQAAAETDVAMQEEQAVVFENTAVSLVGSLAAFGAEGHKNIGQYTALILKTSFEGLKSMIPGWILGLFGSSVSQLGPIAGPLVAAGITGVLYGLLSAAEGAMTGGKGARQGGRIRGGKQAVWLNDDPQQMEEYVIHGEATAEYDSTLDAINRRRPPMDIIRTLLPRVDMRAIWKEAGGMSVNGAGVIEMPASFAGNVHAVGMGGRTDDSRAQTQAIVAASDARNERQSAALLHKTGELVHEVRKVARNTTPRGTNRRTPRSSGGALF